MISANDTISKQRSDQQRAPGRMSPAATLIRLPGVLRNFISYFASRGLSLVIFAVSVPIFIQSHGTEGYGILSLLYSVIGLLVLADLGVSYAVTQRYGVAVARNARGASNIVGAAAPAILGLALTAGAVVFGLSSVISRLVYGTADYAVLVRIFAISVVFMTISSSMCAVYKAHGRISWLNYSRTVSDAVRGLGLLVGALFTDGVQAALVVFAIGSGLRCILDIYLVGQLLGSLKLLLPRWRSGMLVGLLWLGAPVAATGILSMLLAIGDRLIVSRWFGTGGLANYALAADICNKAYFLVWAVSGTLYPLILRAAAVGETTVPHIRASLGAVAVVGLVFYVPLAVFAPQLLELWLGADVAVEVVPLVRICAPVAVAYLIFNVLQSQLLAMRFARESLCVTMVGLAAFLSAAVWLSRSLGVPGVALSMAIGCVSAAALCAVVLMRGGRHKSRPQQRSTQ